MKHIIYMNIYIYIYIYIKVFYEWHNNYFLQKLTNTNILEKINIKFINVRVYEYE